MSLYADMRIYAKMNLMIDDVFAVIADSTRRQILQALADGRRPVGELVEELGISQPTVSKHLKVLRNVKLVKSEASGQKRFYSLTPEPLESVVQWIESLQADENQTPVEEPVVATEEHDIQAETAPVAVETEEAPQVTAEAAPFVSTETRGIPVVKTTQDDAVPAPLPPAPAIPPAPEPEHLAVAEPAAQTPEEESAEPAPVPEEEGYFTLGDEGEIHQHAQPRHSHNALNFTPLEPFVPGGVAEEASAEEIDEDPTTSIDLASIPLLPADEAETNLDVVVVEEEYDEPEGATSEEPQITDETQASDDLPSGYVAYTGEPDTTEFIDDVPEQEPAGESETLTSQPEEAQFEGLQPTDENLVAGTPSTESDGFEEKTETQVVLESADAAHPAEVEHDTENHESRGFLASLTRWGRRRSR